MTDCVPIRAEIGGFLQFSEENHKGLTVLTRKREKMDTDTVVMPSPFFFFFVMIITFLIILLIVINIININRLVAAALLLLPLLWLLLVPPLARVVPEHVGV